MEFPNIEGQMVPSTSFAVFKDGGFITVTTDEIFKNKTVVFFALPGAFTPACSLAHLPRFEELSEVFYANGVDSIVCLAVNDSFVLNEWAKQQGVKNVMMLPDGNAEFAKAIGLVSDRSAAGMSERSWRYSMLVKNGKIEKAFIEPRGDSFEVSGAETMLNYINPNAEIPATATIFTKDGCPFCVKAKAMLETAGIAYDEVKVGVNGLSGAGLRAVANSGAVPQIYIGGEHIGGSTDLEAWLANK